MNTRALALAATVAGIGLGACTGVNESAELGFAEICAMTTDCTFSATCDNALMGSPIFDASVATQLWVAIQMDNRVANNADATVGRVNTNDAHVTSFEITYTSFFLASSVQLTNQTIPAAGSTTVQLYIVPPGSSPGTPLGIIQSVARVKAKGYYDNGSSFETGEFPVAFWYCTNCAGPNISCTAPSVPVLTCGSKGTSPATYACST